MEFEGKCDTKIRSYIEIVKDAFRKPSKVLKHKQIMLETKKEKSKSCIYPPLWLFVLENFFTDEEGTRNNRDIILQTNAENNMDRTCGQCGSSKENRN